MMPKKFARNEDGLATIEWVGIAVLLAVATVAIVSYVNQGSKGAADTEQSGVVSVDASSR